MTSQSQQAAELGFEPRRLSGAGAGDHFPSRGSFEMVPRMKVTCGSSRTGGKMPPACPRGKPLGQARGGEEVTSQAWSHSGLANNCGAPSASRRHLLSRLFLLALVPLG